MILEELIKIDGIGLDSPKQNRLIQAKILTFFAEMKSILGRKFISIAELEEFFKDFDHNSNLEIPKILQKMIELYQLDFIFDTIKVELKPGFKFISNHIKEEIRNYISNKYQIQDPIFLKEKIIKYNHEFNRIKKTENRYQFLVTNPVSGNSEISEKIGDIVNNCSEFLFISVPFFDPDVIYFIELILNRIRDYKIDFKIIYRPDNEESPKFVLKLNSKLSKLGYSNYYRKFDYTMLKPEYKKKIKRRSFGNLHSKLIISDYGAIIGSANYTLHSLRKNFETGIFTNDSNLIKKIKDEFNNVWEVFNEPISI